MKLLSIDTSTDACSVALFNDGISQELYELCPRQHTERVLPMVDELLTISNLSLSELDAIAYGAGPGSFTGVRVATSVIQGLAFSAELPVIAVSSLAALAQQAYRLEQKETIISTIDARMNELYWGCYEVVDGLIQLINTEQVSKPEMIECDKPIHFLGSGWDTFSTELTQLKSVNIASFTDNCLPHAQDVALIAVSLFEAGKVEPAENAIPSYIRNEVTWKKISQQPQKT
ncbi:MAG: tRNA (adenosine(37)-N6)-threonylcarbamoyltransferase complex dimerization subunit type 1 TsaB [Woeseiaceae bacterium]